MQCRTAAGTMRMQRNHHRVAVISESYARVVRPGDRLGGNSFGSVGICAYLVEANERISGVSGQDRIALRTGVL